MGKWDVDNREKFGVKINPSDPKAEYLADKLSGSLEADTVNNKIGLDGDEASPTASKYYGTNAASEKGFHALPDGITVIDDDTFATATSENVASAESVKAYVDNEIADIPDNTPKYSVATTHTLASADTERSTSSGSATKLKEIIVIFSGTVKVYFSMQYAGSGGGTNYAQIYINGVAEGTLRGHADKNIWHEYSEDIAVSSGDLVQLYGWVSSEGVKVKEFRIKSALPDICTVNTD